MFNHLDTLWILLKRFWIDLIARQLSCCLFAMELLNDCVYALPGPIQLEPEEVSSIQLRFYAAGS